MKFGIVIPHSALQEEEEKTYFCCHFKRTNFLYFNAVLALM